jgi:hypothetical protein
MAVQEQSNRSVKKPLNLQTITIGIPCEKMIDIELLVYGRLGAFNTQFGQFFVEFIDFVGEQSNYWIIFSSIYLKMIAKTNHTAVGSEENPTFPLISKQFKSYQVSVERTCNTQISCAQKDDCVYYLQH